MAKIKYKIEEHFKNNEQNFLSFELKAGLKRGTLYNIVSDRSQNPTMDTLIKLANALDCSLDELLGREEYLKKYLKQRRSEIEYDQTLFSEILDIINIYLKDNDLLKATLGDIIYLIDEIYLYSKNSNDGKLDKKFSLWIIKNHFNNN